MRAKIDERNGKGFDCVGEGAVEGKTDKRVDPIRAVAVYVFVKEICHFSVNLATVYQLNEIQPPIT